MLFLKHEWKYIEENTETWTNQSIRRGKGEDCVTYFVEKGRAIRREPTKFSFGPWIEDPVVDERDEEDFGNIDLYEWMNPYYEA